MTVKARRFAVTAVGSSTPKASSRSRSSWEIGVSSSDICAHSSISEESTWRISSPSHATTSSSCSVTYSVGTECLRVRHASVRYRRTTPSERASE